MKLLIMMLTSISLCGCNPDKDDFTLPPNPSDVENPAQTKHDMKITINSNTFKATLVTNATATAFKEMLPLTLNMSDFNNNEKVASLPHSITTAAINLGTIQTGDIMLYGSSSLVLFYETFSSSYSYTRIGRIDDIRGLKAALGKGNISVKFELE